MNKLKNDIRGWVRPIDCMGCIPNRDVGIDINPGCPVHQHMTTRTRR
jgi:hypothetical protein